MEPLVEMTTWCALMNNITHLEKIKKDAHETGPSEEWGLEDYEDTAHTVVASRYTSMFPRPSC